MVEVEVEVEVDRDPGRSQREDEKVNMKQKSDSNSGRGRMTKLKTKGSGLASASKAKARVELATNVRTVQTVRRTTRTRSAIKQEDAVTLQPVQDGRSRGGLKRKRSGDPAGSEVDIELQSARYQHDAIRLYMDSERGSGSGSETELDGDGDDDDEEDEEEGGGGEGNEDEDEDEDITIDGENDGHAIRQKVVLKVKATRVGLWKGYLRLSKVSLSIL